MRIAFFTECYKPQVNGVVVTLEHVTGYLLARSHELLLVVPQTCSDHESDLVKLKCIPFPLYPEMPVILPHWSFHRRQLERLESFHPELVHVWTSGVIAFFGQKWARAHRCPVVASYETDIIRYIHTYGLGRFESLAWYYLKWLFNHCQRTYVPSHETKRFLETNGIQNVEVFERGIDSIRFDPRNRNESLRQQLGVESGGTLVLYVGRLSKEKNLPLLLRSFLHVLRERPQCRLIMTGDGPLRRLLARVFSHPNILFVGIKTRTELASLYASADIFAIPSRTETLSLVSLEAMASGRPVLGMNAGGIRDIVNHRETGLLADSDEEFATFLRLLVSDNALRTTLGAKARVYAEHKSWDESLRKLEQNYLELVSARSTR